MATVASNHPVLGVTAAARRVGVTDRCIRLLLSHGTINGQRLDPDDPDSPWAVDVQSLDAWAATPQIGRGCRRGASRGR